MIMSKAFILAIAITVIAVTAAPTFDPVEHDTELIEREVTDLVKRQ